MNKRERIEQAVIDCGAKWPYGENKMIAMSLGDGEQCTRAEFEHVVGDFKRLRKWQADQYIAECRPFAEWLKKAARDVSNLAEDTDWRTPLPTEQPKSWHEAGELPPDYEAHKRNSELLFDITEFLVANQIGSPGESCVDVVIRELSEKHGIKSEREVVIELANKVCTGIEFASEPNPMEMIIFSKLYDAGMLKLPDGD